MDACISSSTRPFVSGTNKTAEPHMPENMKNVPVPGVVLPKNCFKFVCFFVFFFLPILSNLLHPLCFHAFLGAHVHKFIKTTC
jgi:hypothetical protein